MIRPHDFVIIKFFFVQIDWSERDSVMFHYSFASNSSEKNLSLDYVANGTVGNTNGAAQTALCARNFGPDNVNNNDMMSSIAIRYFDRNGGPDMLSAQFLPRAGFSSKGSWGLNTLIIITGSCSKSCFTCNYDSSETACLTCRNFLAQAANKTCTLCLDGFYYATESSCKKCPITCLRCKYTVKVECTACPEFMVLKDGVCDFISNSKLRFI